jgi:hypothetical protein
MDPFDALLNATCYVIQLADGTADAYGEPVETHTVLASNVPCAVSADAPGRAKEFQSEKQPALNYRRVFMRSPVLSSGESLNENHYLRIDGGYCNIIEVINPGRRNHHLEVIIENFIGSLGADVTPLPPSSEFPFHKVSVDGTNSVSVQQVPRTLLGYRIFNDSNRYPLFVKLHDTAALPVAGVGVAYTIGVQAGRSAHQFPLAIPFNQGIGITIVRGIEDTDATPISANDCVVDLSYE